MYTIGEFSRGKSVFQQLGTCSKLKRYPESCPTPNFNPNTTINANSDLELSCHTLSFIALSIIVNNLKLSKLKPTFKINTLYIIGRQLKKIACSQRMRSCISKLDIARIHARGKASPTRAGGVGEEVQSANTQKN
jgi:hypothetical protein